MRRRPLPAPTVTVTETTFVPGPATPVPGPTVTSKPVEVEVTVPGLYSLSVTVKKDPDEPDTPRHLADFTLVAEEGDKPQEYPNVEPASPFGPNNRLVFLSYSVDDQTLSFLYVDSVFTITVPVTVPAATTEPTVD